MLSLIIPVYRNSLNIPPLIDAIGLLHKKLAGLLEVVFVVDGSPDDSFLKLREMLPLAPFRSQLIALARNFGSFSAIRAGLAAARGTHCAVMAADLQEPIDLIATFDELLRTHEMDIVIGRREGRADPFFSRLASGLFWGAYRRFVQKNIPRGGVDVFACNDRVRRQLVSLNENNSSLIGLLFWVGFRRREVPYTRQEREFGQSAWSLSKKLRYLSDSLFSFTDLPIRLLLALGTLGLLTSVTLSTVVLVSKLIFSIPVPGYAATILTIVFFGALNCFGLGVLGGYLWRTYENSKGRPNFIVMSEERFHDEST